MAAMDLRLLRYVVAVADRLNFTAAARALNVSQPALSQQVRSLEADLGIPLFVRSPQGVVLTQGGRLVVDHARRVIGAAAHLREEVDAFRGARRGRLRLGVTQSFNALHLPPILAGFLADHDGIDVTVLELANPLIVEGVAQGTLDLGVAIGGGDGAVTTLPLYGDRLMLACHVDHPLVAAAAVPLASLARETLAVLTDDFVTRRELDVFLSLHAVAPRRIVSFNTFAGILAMVATGHCVSVIPMWRDEAIGSPTVRFVPLKPSPPRRSTSIIVPAGAGEAPAVSLLANAIIDRFGPTDR